MVFVRKDIPSKLLSKETQKVDGTFVELNNHKPS